MRPVPRREPTLPSTSAFHIIGTPAASTMPPRSPMLSGAIPAQVSEPRRDGESLTIGPVRTACCDSSTAEARSGGCAEVAQRLPGLTLTDHDASEQTRPAHQARMLTRVSAGRPSPGHIRSCGGLVRDQPQHYRGLHQTGSTRLESAVCRFVGHALDALSREGQGAVSHGAVGVVCR